MKRRREPIVIGHRGSGGLKPENQLPAFAEALEPGAGGFKMTSSITKDGQVVVTHDATTSHHLYIRPKGAPLDEQESERLKIPQLRLEEIRCVLAVSGIITDYPDRALTLIQKTNDQHAAT